MSYTNPSVLPELIGYNQALLPAARMLAHTVALKKEHL